MQPERESVGGSIDKPLQNLRILNVVESLDVSAGGLSQAVVSIAQAQRAGGATVAIAAPGLRDESRDGFISRLPTEIQLVFRPVEIERFRVSAGLAVWLYRHAKDYDVIHVHAVWSFAPITALLAGHLQNIPTCLTPHGSLDSYDLKKRSKLKKFARSLFYDRILKSVRIVHFTSHGEQECSRIPSRGPARRVLPLPAPTRSSELPEIDTFGIDPEAPIVFFAGRIHPVKGLEWLIRAFKDVPGQAHLVIAGSGGRDYTHSLRMLVEQQGQSHRIVFTGWISERQRDAWFERATMFALVSDNENFGMVIIEALQAGLPTIVSSGVATSGELAAQGAALVTSQNPIDVARAINRILRDRSLRESLSRNGVSAVQHLELDSIGVDYFKLALATTRKNQS